MKKLLTSPTKSRMPLHRTAVEPAAVALSVPDVAAPDADESTEEQDWRIEGYYRGSGNESFASKFAWFADPYSTELVNTTRARDVPDYPIELLNILKAKHDHTLEKQIVWRAIPYYKKEIGTTANMILATMTVQEWAFYVASMEIAPKMSWRSTSMPDHSCRRPESIHRCLWSYPSLPSLTDSPLWFFKKWFEGEVRYRALVTSLGLVRHSWTGLVRVEFSYKTWFWNINVVPYRWTEI